MSDEPPPLPSCQFKSDDSGLRYMIFDPSDQNFDGWRVEAMSARGSVFASEFQLISVGGVGLTTNLLGYFEQRQAWAAILDHLTEAADLVMPDGRRLPIPGFPRCHPQ
jgi:hypothetical protein